jgi:hypothetical protein
MAHLKNANFLGQPPRQIFHKGKKSHSGGGLKFFFGSAESWGQRAQDDAQTDFFRRKLEASDLLDIALLNCVQLGEIRGWGMSILLKG